METVLVIGSTGNIGTSAVDAALRSGRSALAVVRNQDSAEKLLKNVKGAGSQDRITCVTADITSETGVRDIVDRVRSGTLPRFQHVFTAGAQGDIGARAAPAISQGALFSMANAACYENTSTNVRVNEIYLGTRVVVDSLASEAGAMKASEFAQVYERILARTELRGGRISVFGRDDLCDLKFTKKASS